MPSSVMGTSASRWLGEGTGRRCTALSMRTSPVMFRLSIPTNGKPTGVWQMRKPSMKRSIIGSYHQVSTKHLGAYFDELEFRFNNRENPYMFRDAMLKLLLAETLPYAKLIAED